MGWICLAVGNISVLLMLGRFLVGLGMGIEGSLHSLFVAELMSRQGNFRIQDKLYMYVIVSTHCSKLEMVLNENKQFLLVYSLVLQ